MKEGVSNIGEKIGGVLVKTGLGVGLSEGAMRINNWIIKTPVREAGKLLVNTKESLAPVFERGIGEEIEKANEILGDVIAQGDGILESIEPELLIDDSDVLQAGVVALGFIKWLGKDSFLGGQARKKEVQGNDGFAKVLRTADSAWFVAKRGMHWALVPLIEKWWTRPEMASDFEKVITGLGIMTFAAPIFIYMLSDKKRRRDRG